MNEALRGKVAASYDYGPILCSYRRRFWLEGSQWSLWIDCSPETADDLETRKDLYWEFEVRRFYLEPKVGTATEEMKMAVRWAPSSAYWSARLREFFGPEARMGIDALERQLEAATTASTPQAMAEAFWNMSDEQQAEFFAHLAQVIREDHKTNSGAAALGALQWYALGERLKPDTDGREMLMAMAAPMYLHVLRVAEGGKA